MVVVVIEVVVAWSGGTSFKESLVKYYKIRKKKRTGAQDASQALPSSLSPGLSFVVC